MSIDIDIAYDFRQDTPKGKDPDRYSKTLRQYHKALWSKPLPSGDLFQLNDAMPGHYLYHQSSVGVFSLSSDAVIPTFKWNNKIQAIVPASELECFNAQGYTIGGMMVFPCNRIDGKWTINQARGCTRSIGDRFDLTLECIRRHYINGKSPLTNVFTRYTDFFNLFANFRGYVEFFLLQDLVSEDCSAVHISQPYDDFSSSPIPTCITEYRAYENDALEFINARNQRIFSTI